MVWLLIRTILYAVLAVTSILTFILSAAVVGKTEADFDIYMAGGVAAGFFVCYGTVNIPNSIGGRLPFIIQVFFCTLLAILAPFMPYSARWLLSRGRREEADQMLDLLNYRGHLTNMFQQLSGIDFILFYAPLLFEQAGLDPNTSSFIASPITPARPSVPAMLSSNDNPHFQYLRSINRLNGAGDDWKGWKTRMILAFRTAALYEIVVEGQEEPTVPTLVTGDRSNATVVEAAITARDNWRNGRSKALVFLATTLEDDVLESISEMDAPSAWTYLTGRFDVATGDVLDAIITGVQELSAKGPNGVGNFLDTHEKFYSRSKTVDSPFVRTIPANATAAQLLDARQVHRVYANWILRGLPSSVKWKAWSTAYRQGTPHLEPRAVLNALRSEYNRLKATTEGVDAITGKNGNTRGSSAAVAQSGKSSSTKSSSSSSGTTGGSSSPRQQTRKRCPHCRAVAPNHEADQCRSKPKATSSGQSSTKSGNTDESSSNKPKKDTKTITYAAATVTELDETTEDDESAKAFFLDSCATSHVVADRALFTSYRLSKSPIHTIVGDLESVGVGNVDIEVRVSAAKTEKVTLVDVLHVSSSAFNLISLTRFQKAGFQTSFFPNGDFKTTAPDGAVVLRGKMESNSLPQLATVANRVHALASPISERLDAVGHDHRQFGHPGKGAHRDLLHLGAVTGYTTKDIDSFYTSPCRACLSGKMSAEPFPVADERATLPGQNMDADLAGPFKVPSFGGAIHFLVVRDQATGWIDGEPLKVKSDAAPAFEKILARMKAKFLKSEAGLSPSLTLTTDQGSEFMGSEFQAIFRREGVNHRTSIVYTPQQNGLAERAVRAVKTATTILLADANLSARYWAETFYWALTVINHLPYSPNKGETPYHSLFHTHDPVYAELPLFGQLISVKEEKASTFEDKFFDAFFLGTGELRGQKGFCYQCADARGGKGMGYTRNMVVSRKDAEEIEETPLEEEPAAARHVRTGEPRRGGRDRVQKDTRPEAYLKPAAATATRDYGNIILVASSPSPRFDSPTYFRPEDGEVVLSSSSEVALADVEPVTEKKKINFSGRPLPTSYKTADLLAGPLKEETRDLMQLEWHGYKHRGVIGNLVSPTKGMKILGTRWAHSLKLDDFDMGILKSRLVVQGVKSIPFLAPEVAGPTFTPLPRWDVVAIFFVLATRLRLEIWITDFLQAYTHADFPGDAEPLYIRQPPGFQVPGKDGWVYQLTRPSYGLPQAGRYFHLHTKGKFEELNLVVVSDQATLYVGRRGKDFVLFLLYVDDGAIAGAKSIVEEIIGAMKRDFDVEFKGTIDGQKFLGRNISYDTESFELIVSVHDQIVHALRVHGYDNPKPLHLPVAVGTVLSTHAGAPVRPKEYLSAVGSLQFIAGTRPDVQFAVGLAARFSSNPGPDHWKLVDHIFAYLAVTKDVGMSMGVDCSDGSGLVAWVDADHTGCVVTRRSMTGIVVSLDGSTVLSISRRQTTVTTSTFTSELAAMNTALQQLEWFKAVISSLPIGNTTPITVKSDNKSAVDAIHDETYVEQRKHHDVQLRYVRQQVTSGFADLVWWRHRSHPSRVLHLGSTYINKVGRRKIWIIGGAAIAACHFVIGSMYASGANKTSVGKYVVILFIEFFAVTFTAGWCLITALYAAEIQPARTRAASASTGRAFNQIINFAVAVSGPFFLAESSYGPYFTYGAFSALGVAFGFVFMPEVMGKSLESIDEVFENSPVAVNMPSLFRTARLTHVRRRRNSRSQSATLPGETRAELRAQTQAVELQTLPAVREESVRVREEGLARPAVVKVA
ncbi:hypothetical protein JCM6882_005575 [Rhodosporidiobolus microsporus]